MEHTSGDGTVTYASLTYCLMWKNSIKEVRACLRVVHLLSDL
jgi:hypothetical protein